MTPVELGTMAADGYSIARTYRDDEAGFSGSVSAGMRGSVAHIEHLAAGEDTPQLVEINSDDPQRIVMEDEAALSAIQGVVEGKYLPAVS